MRKSEGDLPGTQKRGSSTAKRRVLVENEAALDNHKTEKKTQAKGLVMVYFLWVEGER